MRILVTGGAGFIGSHLVDELIRKKHKVVVVDDLSNGRKENINPKAKFYKLDINSQKLEDIFKKEKPEIVFHCAAQIDMQSSVKNPLKDARTNILGGLNVLENCHRFGVKKIIFSSSVAVYGETKIIPTPENCPEQPIFPYGIAKLTIEKYLAFYANIFKVPYVILRYSNAYGPRQGIKGEGGVIAVFCKKMLSGKQPVIFGSGKHTRDYVFVSDIVDANILAMKKGKQGIFNVATSRETSVNDVFKKLNKLTGNKTKEIHAVPIKGEQKRSCLAIGKARRELDWQPRISLGRGLEVTASWFRENS